MKCTVFDANDTCAAGTSSVPVAIFRPHLAAAPSVEYSYFLSGFKRLLTELSDIKLTPQTMGVLQVVHGKNTIMPDPAWHLATRKMALAAKIPQTDVAFYIPAAGAINPAQLCQRWLQDTRIEIRNRTTIASISPTTDGWIAHNSKGKPVGRGNLVILANSLAVTNLVDGLTLLPASGQISHFQTTRAGPIICDRGYIIPDAEGVWTGATFHRGVASNTPKSADDERNREFCKKHMAIADTPNKSWAGTRCTTADRMPVIGPVPEIAHITDAYKDLHHGRPGQNFPEAIYRKGLYAFVGLGSRGVVQALHGAECLADSIFGENNLAEATRLAIHPARFVMRSQRRSPA